MALVVQSLRENPAQKGAEGMPPAPVATDYRLPVSIRRISTTGSKKEWSTAT